jgi:hypothetical protein
MAVVRLIVDGAVGARLGGKLLAGNAYSYKKLKLGARLCGKSSNIMLFEAGSACLCVMV